MKVTEIPRRTDFVHHQQSRLLSVIREIVFGAEDGMVSTVGSLTGIAAATSDPFTVVLAGFVIVSVESISMGIGAYLSTKSAQEIDERKIKEERIELDNYPEEEKDELLEMYIADGWPNDVAVVMANTAAKDKELMLKEMVYRELHIDQDKPKSAVRAGVYMFFSYIIGGLIPVIPYMALPLFPAIVTSILITFSGLFILGALTTKFTKRSWWIAGAEMLGLASIAAIVGYGIGQMAETFIVK
jgi:vacuolar iron transporter family protein